MFQGALTTHDIDVDSARGTSIITDDRSSCWFSDDEEVSEYFHSQATPIFYLAAATAVAWGQG